MTAVLVEALFESAEKRPFLYGEALQKVINDVTINAFISALQQ